MQHLIYKKGLQQRLRCWFQGDVSQISQDGMSDLLTYFLRNNQIQEVQKGLRMIAEGDSLRSGSIESNVPLLERLVTPRTREQDFQIPIFMFSISRRTRARCSGPRTDLYGQNVSDSDN